MILKSSKLIILLFCKGPSNILGFEGQRISVATIQLCHSSPKATKGRHTNK